MMHLHFHRAAKAGFVAVLALNLVLPASAAGLLGAPSSMPAGSAIAPRQSMQPAMPAQIDLRVTGAGTENANPPPVAAPVTSPMQTDSSPVSSQLREIPPVRMNGDSALQAAQADAMQAGSKLPPGVRSYEWQLEQLWKKVEDLQRRLALAEKHLAEHRHTYSYTHVNQWNYRTVRHLLKNSDKQDGLLNFPGMPVQRQTGLPLVP